MSFSNRDNDLLLKEAAYLLEKLPLNPGRFTWDFRRRLLMESLLKDGDLLHFLSWHISREALWAGYTEHSFSDLEAIPLLWAQLARDPLAGGPEGPFSPQGASGTSLRQARVVWELRNELESAQSLFEVGGGYGMLAYALECHGYMGRHYIYDFPELHLIRKWWLQRLGVETTSLTEITEPYRADIFVSVHAMCEMPIKQREYILDRVSADTYLFFITNRWDGVDNNEWLINFSAKRHLDYKQIHPTHTNQSLLILKTNDIYGSQE